MNDTANDDTNAEVQEDSVGDKFYAQDVEENEEPKEDAENSEEKSGEESDEKSAEEKSDEESKEQEEKIVPEKYELKLQEESLLGEDHVEKVAALAKEQGLSNDEAQKMLDRDSKLVESIEEDRMAKHEEQMEAWKDQAYNDKEIGGSKENFDTNVESARRAASRFGTDEFKAALDESGLGNHPEILRVFARIGRAMNEDKLIVAHGQGGKELSIENKLYDNSN